MAFSYNLTQNQPDSHQAQNWALILIVRFKEQNTFEGANPTQAFLPIDQQQAINPNDAVAYDKILIRSDILSCNVTSNKNSFTGTATAMLVPGQYDYQYVIFPGDHAFIWMHNDIAQLTRVVNAIQNNTQANDWNSGLKFYGRIESVRKDFTTMAEGEKSIRYQVNFKSFSELNSQIYFNPYMKLSTDGNPLNFFANVTQQYQNLFGPNGQITPTSIIEDMISIFLGNGPGVNSTASGSVQRSSNNAYIIPTAVGQVLGQSSTSNGSLLTYADILNTLLGIQKYTDVNNQLVGDSRYAPFIPLLDNATIQNRQRECADALQGRYLALPDLFNSTTVWSLLQSYLNTTLNEMYLTLRTDEFGFIYPTLIARQIPFSTPKISVKNVKNTQFNSIPQWSIDPSIRIASYNIGTSDVMRVNFVQFYGQVFNSRIDAPTSIAGQSGNENFKEDRLDILRNGGRNIITTSNTIVNTDPNTTETELADNYSSLLADWFINGHLKLTGTINMVGIAEPICIGDNITYDEKIFHIESVTHRYAMEGINKTFTTTLELVNGMLNTGQFIQELPLNQSSNIAATTNEQYNTTVEMSNQINQNPTVNPNTPANATQILSNIIDSQNINPQIANAIKQGLS